MLVSTRPEPIRKATKVRLIYFIENGHHSLLNDFVFQRRHSQRELHLTTAHIWDGLRSGIHTILCEASAFES